ncbi:myotrophin-like [Dysidea avara]|uniref:myotrophin-like n=1 Tax=Dysidea avara TaxID=196820 RepID=UPI0033298009
MAAPREHHNISDFWNAVSCGRLEDVKEYLSDGVDVNMTDVVSGDTPLHKAVKNGHTLVAELLLSTGANVNILNEMMTLIQIWNTCWALMMFVKRKPVPFFC